MKKVNLILLATILAFVCSCRTETLPESPLTGVWELVSGEWEIQDSTFVLPGPGMKMKSMKFYSREHFFCIGTDAPGMEHYAFCGTYTIDGDRYTEKVTMSSGDNVGAEYPIKFEVSGDSLKLEGEWFRETWEKLEQD